MYVCEFEHSIQFISGCSEAYREPEVRSVTVRAWDSVPLRVRAVCLPYVFVRTPDRKHRTIDTRATKLVRLPERYAERVVAALHEERRRKRKKSKK